MVFRLFSEADSRAYCEHSLDSGGNLRRAAQILAKYFRAAARNHLIENVICVPNRNGPREAGNFLGED
jgi:hypothetical protein